MSEEKNVESENAVMATMPEEVRNRKPIATLCLIGVSVLVAVLMFCWYGTEPKSGHYILMGASLDSFTLKGQIWRLLSSSFVHFGIIHLCFNMLCLLSLGMFLEKLIGSWKLCAVYFLSAIAGGMLSMAFHPNAICGGASGAVFGLFSAAAVYVWMGYREWGVKLEHVAAYMKDGLAFIGINFLYSLAPDVDLAGHVGGLLGGALVGVLLGIPVKFKGMPHREWWHRGLGVVAGVLALAMLVSVFTVKGVGRKSPKELAVEVGDFMKEKMLQNLKDGGAKKVSVEIKELELSHDGGDDYHGSVVIDCLIDGEPVKLNKSLKVSYDGLEYGYKMSDD